MRRIILPLLLSFCHACTGESASTNAENSAGTSGTGVSAGRSDGGASAAGSGAASGAATLGSGGGAVPSAGASSTGQPMASDDAGGTGGSTEAGMGGSTEAGTGGSGASTEAGTGGTGGSTEAGTGGTGGSTEAGTGGSGGSSEAGAGGAGGSAAGGSSALGGAAGSSDGGAAGSGESEAASETQSYVFTASTDGTIRAFLMDETSGALDEVADYSIQADNGDFFLALGADLQTLFISYNRGVSALRFDAGAQAFTLIAEGSTSGVGTHIAVSRDDSAVLVAHYNEGSVTHLSYDGSSFSSGTEYSAGQNAHSARIHPSGKWVYVPCLGSNHIAQYALGSTLSELMPPTVSISGGPRHMTFHPSIDVAYVLTEKGGEIHTLALDTASGVLSAEIDVDTFAAGGGEAWGSDVHVTPDGKHLYAVERNARSIYHFDIAADGSLEASGAPTELGAVVRAFAIAPDGALLQVGDADGSLTAYLVGSDGALSTQTDQVRGLGDVHATLVAALPVPE